MTRMEKQRLTLGLSRKTLGQKIGVTEEAVRYWEKEERTPSAEFYPLLAKALKVDPDEVIGWFHKGMASAKR
jgi:transcriptional regulator with XRE-family HTH domain